MRSIRPGPDPKIKFRYLAEHDVVLATVEWQLDSQKDVEDWQKAYEDYFSRNHKGRKVDVIFELSKFSVSPRMGAAFGEARAKMMTEFTRRTYRVNLDDATRTAMYTSRVLHGAAANEFDSVEDAIAQLKLDRASDAKA
jgi:hypothetical protein